MERWPRIDPGSMIHWVTIRKQFATTDISGSIVGWADLYSAWAAITVANAVEVLTSGQSLSQVPVLIQMYFQPEIRSNMRVQSNNGLYLIQGLQNVKEMNIVLNLFCIALGEND